MILVTAWRVSGKLAMVPANALALWWKLDYWSKLVLQTETIASFPDTLQAVTDALFLAHKYTLQQQYYHKQCGAKHYGCGAEAGYVQVLEPVVEQMLQHVH